jgi:hypothetical protein
MVAKVVLLLQRAEKRKRFKEAAEWLKERVGQELPSLGGVALQQEALEEALKLMAEEAD